jgi:hypothetical protein
MTNEKRIHFQDFEFPSFGFVLNFGFRISSFRFAVLLLLVFLGIPVYLDPAC